MTQVIGLFGHMGRGKLLYVCDFFCKRTKDLKQLIMIRFADPSASFECTNLAD